MAAQTQSRPSQNQRFEGMQHSTHGDDALKPFDDLYNYFRDYAKERPDVMALWCFGIGFVLGWKLKPW